MNFQILKQRACNFLPIKSVFPPYELAFIYTIVCLPFVSPQACESEIAVCTASDCVMDICGLQKYMLPIPPRSGCRNAQNTDLKFSLLQCMLYRSFPCGPFHLVPVPAAKHNIERAAKRCLSRSSSGWSWFRMLDHKALLIINLTGSSPG